jgi:hypothetical protein
MSFGIPVRNGLAIGLLSSTTLSSNGGLFPAMSLDFLQPYLDSRVTFSRGSNATLVDATGKITYAPANLLFYTQEFDNGVWIKLNTSVTANSTVAPDGTTTADTLTSTSSVASTTGAYRGTTPLGAGHTMTVYAKAGSSSIAWVSGDNGQSYGVFNLANGTVITSANATASIISAGNGWYRLVVAKTTVDNTFFIIGGKDSYTSGGPWSNGTWTSGNTIFIWGAQLEPVTYQTTPSTYVATTASAYYGPRFDYDPVTLAPKGLLIEEQRTNLLTYSDQFNNTSGWTATGATVSANTTSSPDGTVNADSLVEDTSTGVHRVFATPSCSVSTAYTYTAYIKAAGRTEVRLLETTLGGAVFNLSTVAIIATDAGITASIQDAGNGWRRCRITATTGAAQVLFVAQIQASAASSTTYTGNGTTALYLYGAQVEAGSFATSYIPTVASQVTRSADVATMTGTNFSSWYNQPQGTLVADFTLDMGIASLSGRIATLGDVTGNFRVVDLYSTTNWVMYNGTTAIASSVVATTSNTPVKMAAAYATGSYALSVNGATAATDATALVNTATQLTIGRYPAGSNYLNGHIRSIAYYNTRLTNTQLQQLSAPPLVTTLSLDFINGVYDA